MSERRRRRALITRPQEDSADAAIALARRGITPVLAPMMRIEYAAAEIENEVTLAQAVLFTSRNGVRAFTRLSPRRDVAAFAVGDSTATLARDNGFVHVESAHGDSADLARLVAERLDPADGLLFHAAGETVAGELVETLNKAGFKTVRRALYEAKPVDTLAEDTVTALRDRTLDYVLFFSPRTAHIFCDLVDKAGLAATCDSLTAICLSEAVAAEISRLTWKATGVAAAPTTDALLTVIGSFDGNSGQISASPGTPPTDKTPAEAPVEASIETADERALDAAAETTTETTVENTDSPADHNNVEDDTAADSRKAPQSAAPATPAEPVRPTASPAAPPSEKLPEKPSERPAGKTTGRTAKKTPAPASRSSSFTRSLPAAAVIAIAVLAAGYMTLPSWRDKLPVEVRERLAGTDGSAAALRRENTELLVRIDDLDKILVAANAERAALRKKAGAEIGALTARLMESEKAATELRESAAAATDSAKANRALTEKVAALESTLAATTDARDAAIKKARAAEATQSAAALEAATAAGALNGKVATLEKELATVRQAVLTAGKSDTIALAAGKLRDAVARAAPYTAEIAALKRLGGANPDIAGAIARMEPFAATGVPSRATLFSDLPAAVDAILAAARAPAKTGWVDRVADKLTGFITIRRIDGKGTGVEPALARAEIAAKRGDLAAAVKELSALTGAGAKAAGPWLKAAQSRLTAEGAGTTLDKIVLAAFAKAAAANEAGK